MDFGEACSGDFDIRITNYILQHQKLERKLEQKTRINYIIRQLIRMI